MNLEEAIKLVLNGKTIRAKEWEEGMYFRIQWRMFETESTVRSKLWKWKDSEFEEVLFDYTE